MKWEAIVLVTLLTLPRLWLGIGAVLGYTTTLTVGDDEGVSRPIAGLMYLAYSAFIIWLVVRLGL